MKFTMKKEEVISIRERVRGMMSWKTMVSKTGEWIEKGRKNGSSSYIRVIIEKGRSCS